MTRGIGPSNLYKTYLRKIPQYSCLATCESQEKCPSTKACLADKTAQTTRTPGAGPRLRSFGGRGRGMFSTQMILPDVGSRKSEHTQKGQESSISSHLTVYYTRSLS